MNVRELIKDLEQYDPDLPVYVRGYEGGVDDVELLKPVRVRRSYYEQREWMFGRHEVTTADTEDSVPGLQLLADR